ncbi:hypothetical protein DUI87_22326 [Hirundo rustica rustica]|uniref:Reverse transcriptase/retrotransposon-derived protein RNase H-like domain-containing protein n=1 Tax=Hirundo rustica rustica TaxID=333673 RepID=A0A3M0JIX0_HIRRU|nr:hypothetical protein DUI87_22326 [Hirundo rustica rustica]
MSVSTQAVTEEKETKGAISISTQTVTEAEQLKKPVAVAPVQKKKSKSKSVRRVTDEDVAGPSHSAEETEPEIITRSLSLGELHDLRREFTRQTNESFLTWLLRIWDAAANDTILDGSEARQLGSLSRDVVIDQGIGRTQQTLSLWQRLLTSVRDRYLCKEDLQGHQGKWSTMEQGIRCLRELAVLEIIFSEDERFPKSPDDVQCTLQMWLRFARLGPEMYSHYLAMLQWREGEDKVGVLVNKLRIYEDTVTAPFRTHVSSVETRLAEQVWSLIEEGQHKLKKKLKEEIYYISLEPARVSAIRSRKVPAADCIGSRSEFNRERVAKHPIVTGPEAPCILGIDYLRNGYFKDTKDDSCAAGLLRVEEQQVPIATATVHCRQYRTDRDSVIPIHEMIRKLESQGLVSKACSPFNSPIWPVRNSSGEWRLTVDYRTLNEVTPPLSAAVPDVLELQYNLETKAAKWYAKLILPMPFSAFLWQQSAGPSLPSPGRAYSTAGTDCPGVEAQPHHLPWTDPDCTGKGEVRLRDRLKKPVSGSQVARWMSPDLHRSNQQDHCHVSTNQQEGDTSLGAIGFWRMHIPKYSQIVSPLYLVTRKKNDFHWGPEQQQAFAQIKQEIAHAVALGPVRTGPDVKNVLYSAAGNNGLSWSLWQKAAGETQGQPLGFWSQSYRGSEANYTPTKKKILATYEGVQAASEVIGTEMQLLLAPRLPVLRWMFKGKVPSTHHATNTTWSKWIALITHRTVLETRIALGFWKL